MYLRFYFIDVLKGANRELFYVLLRHMYSTVTIKHFILKRISFPAITLHVISHLVTPPLDVLTAWILFGIDECMTSRSSEFNVHQI